MTTRSRIARACAGMSVGALAIISLTACGASAGADADDPPGILASTLPAPSQNASASRSAALPMTRSEPVRLRIPRIDVESSLMRLGLQSDGSLVVPPSGFPAGWFTGAPTAGELGPAIIVGHVHWDGAPGVFWDLHRLSRGDEILVTERTRARLSSRSSSSSTSRKRTSRPAGSTGTSTTPGYGSSPAEASTSGVVRTKTTSSSSPTSAGRAADDAHTSVCCPAD